MNQLQRAYIYKRSYERSSVGKYQNKSYQRTMQTELFIKHCVCVLTNHDEGLPCSQLKRLEDSFMGF